MRGCLPACESMELRPVLFIYPAGERRGDFIRREKGYETGWQQANLRQSVSCVSRREEGRAGASRAEQVPAGGNWNRGF